MALALTVTALATAVTQARPADPDPKDILRQAEEVRSPDLDYAVDFTLRVVNPDTVWKERVAHYTMIAHGKDYSLILMRHPKQFYPGTLLIMRNLYWLLFPRSDKPIQLSAQHILNGDISNGDLARGNLMRHYDVRLDGEEPIEGARCWRLELTRSNNVPHYPRILYWVDQKKGRPRKLEYFGKTGSLLKSVHYEDYQKGILGARSMRIEVETHSREGESTSMVFSNLREMDVSHVSFTTEGMKAFRDAARDRLERDGEQVEPEDLLASLGSDTP